MKPGDVIKWETDLEIVLGVVTTLTDKRVEFQTVAQGLLSVPLNDGTFTVVKNSNVLAQIKAKETEMAAKTKTVAKAKAKKVVAKKTAEPRQGSKMERAIELYKANQSGDRKAIIKLFIDKAGLTPAGASTYLALIKKKLKSK